jgi:hypothetical protein
MWVFLNDAMLSMVAPDAKLLDPEQRAADLLMVRARFEGDIERVFATLVPELKVEATKPDDHARDYAFRALIPRRAIEDAMVGEVRRIDYQNFKGSTQEDWRHDVYMRCWTPMKAEQDRRRPKAPRKYDRWTSGGDPWGADMYGDAFWEAAGYQPAPKKGKAKKGSRA